MPADLDDLFVGLARAADAVPLGAAERARCRGRQRNRNQAVLAAAVVLLVAVGVVAGLRPQRHDAQPVAPVRPLTEVGSPIEFGGKASAAYSTIAGERSFTAWRSADGTVRVVAQDLHTAAVAWPARSLGRFDDFASVTAVPQALLVFVVPDSDAVPLNDIYPDREIHVLDPATGRERWKVKSAVADSLLVNDRGLVRTEAGTGRTEAFDWSTGATLWSVPAGADRAQYTVGMRTANDEDITRQTDDRMVQVTKSGQVRVVDTTDGRLLKTTTIPAPGQGYTFIAYEGWLFNNERSAGVTSPFRVRATDLSSGNSSVLLDLPAGHEVGSLWPCGSGRLCVSETDRDVNTTVRAIEVAGGQQLWQMAGPRGGAYGFSMRGYSMLAGNEATLLDPSGRPVTAITGSDSLHWLGDDGLLVVTKEGTVQKMRLSDGRTTTLGQMPVPASMCVNTDTRIVCPSETEVRTWSLTG
uniref:outer membrane protein assembly factor BamB family protein n=1 Tax=Paractinoplanes polyasparticus TaxID=2856853 RepID=UPI001C84E262|nr:PQQ-binding-like beta-propeller repeat protein [Actinoplanes polyasparticus]